LMIALEPPTAIRDPFPQLLGWRRAFRQPQRRDT
jgi:hypothetical protein